MNGYVKGFVYTYLDGYEQEIWPTVFYKIPEVGQKIESFHGKLLTVRNIIHCYGNRAYEQPCIKIEVGRHSE